MVVRVFVVFVVFVVVMGMVRGEGCLWLRWSWCIRMKKIAEKGLDEKVVSISHLTAWPWLSSSC